MKISVKDFLSKCDQIRSFLRIWSQLLKKSLMGNFISCAVIVFYFSYLYHSTEIFKTYLVQINVFLWKKGSKGGNKKVILIWTQLKIQKQPPQVLYTRDSQEMPVLESLFNKVARLYACFVLFRPIFCMTGTLSRSGGVIGR